MRLKAATNFNKFDVSPLLRLYTSFAAVQPHYSFDQFKLLKFEYVLEVMANDANNRTIELNLIAAQEAGAEK